MRWRSVAIAAVAVAAAGITMTARAAWSDGATVDAGTLTGGRVSLVLGAGGTGVETYSFTALGGTDLGPGAVRQAPLSVTNDGDVGVRYRNAAVSLGALAGQATVTWTRVASEPECPASGTPVGLAGDVTQLRPLEPAQTEVWCVRLTLGTNPPQNLSNAPVTFTFSAEQARHA